MKKSFKYLGILSLMMVFVACNGTNVGGTNETNKTRTEDEQPSEITLTDAYYWGGDEKIPLERIGGKFMVIFYSENEAQFMDELAKAEAEVSCVDGAHIWFSSNRKRATVEGDFEKIEDALALTFYWEHYYRQEDGRDVWTDGTFGVRLKSETDYSALEKMAKENGVEIAYKYEYAERIYYLACSNDSNGNAVEMANLFHESGLFEYADPNLAGIIDQFEF
jgi:hypothetical protein